MATYKQLKVWQMAILLTNEVNELTKANFKRKTHPDEFNLIHEIRDCATNIHKSISMGAEVKSSSRFLSYLRIANSASIELDTKLRIAKDVGEIANLNIRHILDKIEEFQKMLTRLRRPLELAVERGYGRKW
ncbi:MAG: four helix bundle protein [Bacteroidota bacterium]